MRSFCLGLLFAVAVLTPGSLAAEEPVRIGSKAFTESYVLGEIMKEWLGRENIPARHRQGMGGTIILWEALRSGAIDLYPDYTGTIRREILKTDKALSAEQLRRALKAFGIGMTRPLGFNNTYALVLSPEAAEEYPARAISDLRRYPRLRAGFTHEFLKRGDGWAPLKRYYDLPLENVRGIEHSLGYQALATGQLDLKEAYSTDAKIRKYGLVPLEDDKGFFPDYDGVFLYRLDLDPVIRSRITSLAGKLDEEKMRELNYLAETANDYSLAAAAFFGKSARPADRAWRKIMRWTLRHLYLVTVSLLLAVAFGLPLGIRASRGDTTGHAILSITSMIYTIPSLALLALLVPVPFLGISPATAILALFLYSLLPIVRNTAAGLENIPRSLRDSATVLGLSPRARLFEIYLPIASRTILAGIKTSTVINIGTATLAALIGAGGLGEPILSGLNLNDPVTILQGAVPAALLALAAQLLFKMADTWVIPRGLRTRP